MIERSCVNVFGLDVELRLLRASMGISAHSFSLAERPVMATLVARFRMRLQTLIHLSFRLADLGGFLPQLIVNQRGVFKQPSA